MKVMNKKEFKKRIPLGRYGKVEEVSEFISFLASDGGAYITGQNIYVTGVSHVTGSIVTVSGGTSFVTGQTILITGETVVTNITGGIFNNTSGNLYVTGQDNTFNIDESINLINSTGGQWHFTGGTNRTTINTSGENTFSGYIDTINYFTNKDKY